MSHGDPKVRACLAAGDVVTLNQRVEAGDPVGHVGTVSRGPEQGPEVHFEIFTTDRLGGDFGHVFHYVSDTADGAILRPAAVEAAAAGIGHQLVAAAVLT